MGLHWVCIINDYLDNDSCITQNVLTLALSGPVKYQGNRIGYAISNLAVEGSKTVETIDDKSWVRWWLHLFGTVKQLASLRKSKPPPFATVCQFEIWLDQVDIKFTCCGKQNTDLSTRLICWISFDISLWVHHTGGLFPTFMLTFCADL